MSIDHTERPAEGAEFKPLTLRARWWDSGEPPTVLTKPRHAFTEAYEGRETEVYLPDGTWIGTVSKYSGSIDTKIKGTRLRRQGVTRTLWSYNLPGNYRTMFGEVSRADCIRNLISHHERKNR